MNQDFYEGEDLGERKWDGGQIRRGEPLDVKISLVPSEGEGRSWNGRVLGLTGPLRQGQRR